MPKLKLKRTPEEQLEHDRRKRRKEEKKRHRNDHTARKWASDDDDIPEDRYHDDEQRFREKIFDAMEDDERLDTVEARFNDYAHVPDRWKSAGQSSKTLYDEDEFLHLDPSTLDDEEYSEWVRLGMYRKTHAAEHAERLRQKAAAAERRAADKAWREETKRLEKLGDEERKRKKQVRRELKQQHARAQYHSRWVVLLADTSSEVLDFYDIPWPVSTAGDGKLDLEDFTQEAITTFLLPSNYSGTKERKERLRETFLRFHPDKFEGRFMNRIKEADKEKVREAIGQVSRVLNQLLAAEA